MDLMSTAQLLGSFGEFVGAIAVVATLAYLAIQVRQSREATERNSEIVLAQNYQSRSETAQRAACAFADSQYIAPLLGKLDGPFGFDPSVLDAISEEERTRLHFYYQWLVLAIDNQLYQFERGFMDEDFYRNVLQPAIEAMTPMWEALELLGARREGFLKAVEPYRREISTEI